MRQTVTEEYDGQGKLVRRVVVTEEEVQPWWVQPYVVPIIQQPYSPPHYTPFTPIITCASALQLQ